MKMYSTFQVIKHFANRGASIRNSHESYTPYDEGGSRKFFF